MNRKIYATPQSCYIIIDQDDLLCDSPAAGSQETITYEDWNL